VASWLSSTGPAPRLSPVHRRNWLLFHESYPKPVELTSCCSTPRARLSQAAPV
jgi:hypothetical protein